MSVDNSNVVDAIGTEKDGSGVTLTVSDHLEWGNDEHLYKLQEKLNTYLAFIESGEILETYPEAKGKKIKISVVCKYKPDEQGETFFSKCTKIAESAGLTLTYEVYGT